MCETLRGLIDSYGSTTKMEFFMIASSRKETHQPQDARQQQAQDDARDQWEVEPETLPFHCDIAGQLSQPRDMGSEQPDRTDPGYHQSNHNQCPRRMLHGLLRPWLLDLRPVLLHLLTQIGKLGCWFSWHSALLVGHGGSHPI